MFAYNGLMSARVCIVTFTDPSGVVHSVEVAAESLYEAAALGVAEFRSTGLADAAAPAPATAMTVVVKVPSAEHRELSGELRKGGQNRSHSDTTISFRLMHELSRASAAESSGAVSRSRTG